LRSALPVNNSRSRWHNIGGQLMPEESVNRLLADVKSKDINTWDQVHKFYRETSLEYPRLKLEHAYAAVIELLVINDNALTGDLFFQLLEQALATKEWMTKGIYQSRAKDYTNRFRTMVYDSKEEMEEVIGKIEDNVFLKQQGEDLAVFREKIEKLMVVK
jgi:hypothetical protein